MNDNGVVSFSVYPDPDAPFGQVLLEYPGYFMIENRVLHGRVTGYKSGGKRPFDHIFQVGHPLLLF